MWKDGIVFCVYQSGNWTLSIGGPSQATGQPSSGSIIGSGQTPHGIQVNQWYSLSLTTVGSEATGRLNGNLLFSNQAIRDLDTGFAGIGSNKWVAVEYDRFSITEVGSAWGPPAACKAEAGVVLHAAECISNGLASDQQTWQLQPDWGLYNPASGLCASATSKGEVTLGACDPNSTEQQFRNDYTRIRAATVSMTVGDGMLVGSKDGTVSIANKAPSDGWGAWTYFPNTGQLRNQHEADTNLGYPLCLTTCTPSQ